jgi:hypothetical protein
VLRGIKSVRPTGEHFAVIRVTELVVLPGVNEFVSDGRTELFPPVVFVGRPSQRNHDLLSCRIILRDACLSLGPVRDLPVDCFDRQIREVLDGDLRCVLLCSVEQTRLCCWHLFVAVGCCRVVTELAVHEN